MHIKDAMEIHYPDFKKVTKVYDDNSAKVFTEVAPDDWLVLMLAGPTIGIAIAFYWGYEFGQYVARLDGSAAELERMVR